MGGFAWSRVNGTFMLLPVAVGSSMVALGVLPFAIHVFGRLAPRTSADGYTRIPDRETAVLKAQLRELGR